jgi:hypothetical protein
MLNTLNTIARGEMGFLQGYSVLGEEGEPPAEQLRQIAASTRGSVRLTLEQMALRSFRCATTTTEAKKRFVQHIGRCIGAVQYTTFRNLPLAIVAETFSFQGIDFLRAMVANPLYLNSASDMESSRLQFLFSTDMPIEQICEMATVVQLVGEPVDAVGPDQGSSTLPTPSAATRSSIRTSVSLVRSKS